MEHVLGDEDRSGSREHRAQTAASHRTQQTSRSGASAWEDLGQSPGLAPGSSPSARKGQGDAELDDYLKVRRIERCATHGRVLQIRDALWKSC